MEHFTVISGCSGGGKSTLLAELSRRGHHVIEEPGRRIVAEELARGGEALPWIDMEAFARRVLALALEDFRRAGEMPGRVFFDRGLIDAATALRHAAGEPLPHLLRDQCRYGGKVFLTPPWPEIYAGDGERRHDFTAAIAEYDRLCWAYPTLGYDLVVLPRTSVPERADFVLRMLEPA